MAAIWQAKHVKEAELEALLSHHDKVFVAPQLRLINTAALLWIPDGLRWYVIALE